MPGILPLLSILAPVGKQLLDRRSIGKADDKNRDAQATANLINLLSPGAGFQANLRQPKSSGLANILGAVGQGAGAINSLQDVGRARELADLQKTALQQKVTAGGRAADIAAGGDKFFASEAGKVPELARQASVVSRGPQLGNLPKPGFLSSGARAQEKFNAPIGPAQQRGFEGARLGQEQQGILNALARVKSDQAGRKLDQGDRALDISATDAETRSGMLGLRQDQFNNSLNKTGLLAPDQVLKQENTLRKEYDGLTEDFTKVRNAFVRILATSKNPSAAGDLALIFNFMKMLDPGSVVRESEFKVAEGAGAFSDKVQNMINKFWDGERLTVTREDFINQAEALFDGQLATQDELASKYQGIAGRQGLDVRNIVFRFPTPNAKDVAAVIKLDTPSGERVQKETIQATLERAEAGDKSAKVQLLAWGYN